MPVIDNIIAISRIYQKAILQYEAVIKPYNFKHYQINETESVYIVEDIFAIYIGIINFGEVSCPVYYVVFEELLCNSIYKFVFTQFKRHFSESEASRLKYKRFKGIWGEAIRDYDLFRFPHMSHDEIEKKFPEYYIASKADYVSQILPEINLVERFEDWNGYLLNYIVYELTNNGKTGYAICCTNNPQIHKIARKKANVIEQCGLEYYALKQREQEQIALGNLSALGLSKKVTFPTSVHCDETMLENLAERIEEHKANGWKQKYKKNLSPYIFCIAEHDLKYFWISKYIKRNSPYDIQNRIKEVFLEIYNGNYDKLQRYEYLLPENKWKSEQLVYQYVSQAYRKYDVLYQHRPFFLKSDKGQMSYDVFICGLNIAIEYQGKQHFEPVEIFGGKEHYEEQVYRDKLKQKLSEEHGIHIVYINYWEDICPDLIKRRITEALHKPI